MYQSSEGTILMRYAENDDGCQDGNSKNISRSEVTAPADQGVDFVDTLLARGRTEMFYCTLLVTPEIALRFLANNPNNRNVRLKGTLCR